MKLFRKSTRLSSLLILTAAGLGVAVAIQAMPLKSAAGPAALSGSGPDQGKLKPCCIAGKYNGSREGTSGTCPEPKTENFTMQISQGTECDSAISGTIVGESDPSQVQNFTGTVTQSTKKGCCDIKGKFAGESEVTEFQGTFCRKGNKWSGSGTYKSTDANGVCTGTWKMSQI